MMIPLSQWTQKGGELVFGHIVQVLPGDEGLLVQRRRVGLWSASDDLVRLKHLPNQRSLVDNDPVIDFAKRIGRYQYTSTTGATKTVLDYDYGNLPTEAEIKAYKETLAAIRSQKVNDTDRQRKAVAEAKIRRAAELEQKALANTHVQASNGYPSFQFDLGVRYATGRGVDLNMDLARHWLNAAMTNGSTEATNAFRKFFSP
jgi:TPR repeat protein